MFTRGIKLRYGKYALATVNSRFHSRNYHTTNAHRSNLFFKDDIKQDCEIQMNTMMKCIILTSQYTNPTYSALIVIMDEIRCIAFKSQRTFTMFKSLVYVHHDIPIYNTKEYIWLCSTSDIKLIARHSNHLNLQ